MVRAYLGLARFDTVAQTKAINQLYEKMWLYYNFFQPVMRLKEKTTASLLPAEGQPPRIKRRFDQARTPFDRLCETDAISEDQKEQLRTVRDQVNPRQLRREIYQLIDQIFLLPSAVPGEKEDAYETLSTPITSQKGEGIPVTLSFGWTRYWCAGGRRRARRKRFAPLHRAAILRADAPEPSTSLARG